MQKQVRQQRTDNSALRRPFLRKFAGPIRHFNRGLKPPLDIQEHPLLFRMPAHRLHHQFMIDIIEKAFDVEIKYPVILPATLTRHPHRIQCRFARTVAIRVRMKVYLQFRL